MTEIFMSVRLSVLVAAAAYVCLSLLVVVAVAVCTWYTYRDTDAEVIFSTTNPL